MKPDRPPIKISDEDPTRLLLLEEWYELFEPIYRYASDTAMDPVFDVVEDEIKVLSEEIIEYIEYGGETALMVIGVVISMVVAFARAGFSLGKFEYISGQLGTSRLGQSKLGQGLEAREI
jgi:Zn/Cd-binding protein ZinT